MSALAPLIDNYLAGVNTLRQAVAGMTPAQLTARPVPGKWSPLEYGCHVRDVLRLYDERLGLMLTLDEPHYPNWDQNETAVADRYGEQDPAAVAAELQRAAEAIAARFEGVSGDQWQRTGVRSDGARFTVEEFAPCDQYTLQGDAFARAIRNGTPPPVPLEDSVRTMAVIDAVFRAAESGKWEKPESYPT